MSHDDDETGTARTCPWCDDPLPVDGACDCVGDPDRDYRTQKLQPHPVFVASRGEWEDGLPHVMEVYA